MNDTQVTAVRGLGRRVLAFGSALLAGAALLSGAPEAKARDNVRVSISVGAPGYHVGYHQGYRPVHYVQPVYAYAPPPRAVRRPRIVCDEWGYCVRGGAYRAQPVYYTERVVVREGYRGHRHHRHRGHGHKHGHRHGHGHHRH